MPDRGFVRRLSKRHTTDSVSSRRPRRRVSEKRSSTPHPINGVLGGEITALSSEVMSSSGYGTSLSSYTTLNLRARSRNHNNSRGSGNNSVAYHTTKTTTSYVMSDSSCRTRQSRSRNIVTSSSTASISVSKSQLPSNASFHPLSSRPGTSSRRVRSSSRSGKRKPPAVPRCAPRRTNPPPTPRSGRLPVPRYDHHRTDGLPPAVPRFGHRGRGQPPAVPRAGPRAYNNNAYVNRRPRHVDIPRYRPPCSPPLRQRRQNLHGKNNRSSAQTRARSPRRESLSAGEHRNYSALSRARRAQCGPPPAVPRCGPRRFGGQPAPPPNNLPQVHVLSSGPPPMPPALPPSPPSSPDVSVSSDSPIDVDAGVHVEVSSADESSLPMVRKPQKKVKTVKEKDTTEAEATNIARRIINEKLTLRCPERTCRRAFVDFDACFAVQCHSCETYFCAWCLVYHHWNHDSVYNHIDGCSEAAQRGFSHPFEVFVEHHRIRRRDMVINMLGFETTKVRTSTLRKLSKNLQQLDIDISPEDLEL